MRQVRGWGVGQGLGVWLLGGLGLIYEVQQGLWGQLGSVGWDLLFSEVLQ